MGLKSKEIDHLLIRQLKHNVIKLSDKSLIASWFDEKLYKKVEVQ